ncbi:MAG: four helix bundle protein [Patescibacteria group bacterium]|nr:four helix bundle protein [Patescibacteria group bacterium]MDE2438097.1 four helix bundle protein [Patescibacteria group bacterium]
MQSFKDLIVWQKAFDLAMEIYQITNLFPRVELYGLSSQMRRSAVSISSNIAEGFNRNNKRESLQFIMIAFGSSAELETQLLLAEKLRFVNKTQFQKSYSLLEEVRKILSTVRKKSS